MCILLYAVSKVLCMYQTSSETSEAPFYLSLKKQNRGYVSMKRKTVQKAGAVSAAVVMMFSAGAAALQSVTEKERPKARPYS